MVLHLVACLYTPVTIVGPPPSNCVTRIDLRLIQVCLTLTGSDAAMTQSRAVPSSCV